MIIFQFLTIPFTSFIRQIFGVNRQLQATAASPNHPCLRLLSTSGKIIQLDLIYCLPTLIASISFTAEHRESVVRQLVKITRKNSRVNFTLMGRHDPSADLDEFRQSL
jgi:hypothetical protein